MAFRASLDESILEYESEDGESPPAPEVGPIKQDVDTDEGSVERRLEEDKWYILGGKQFNVAKDEGQGLQQFYGMTLDDCEQQCEKVTACHSIAYARHKACFLKSTKFEGWEETVLHGSITTYYFGQKPDPTKVKNVHETVPHRGVTKYSANVHELEAPDKMPDWKLLEAPSFDSAEEAEPWLTTWRCMDAHGSRYNGAYKTCHFTNLYLECSSSGAFELVAHTLRDRKSNSSPETFMGYKMSLGVTKDFGTSAPHLTVRVHGSASEFARHLKRGMLTDQAGLSLVIAPPHHFNIGHGLWDGLYPGFVSMIQLGLHDKPFRSFVMSKWSAVVEKFIPGGYVHVEEAFGLIGLMKTIRLAWATFGATKDKPIVHRLEEAVVGVGSNAQQLDANFNSSLGACRELDACRIFRDRVFWSQGLPPPEPARRSGPFRVILVHNKRFGTLESVANELKSMAQAGDEVAKDFEFNYVVWSPGTRRNVYLQSGNFTRHMEIIGSTDVHVSGGGTGQMYQNFLPDGAVHIALGEPNGMPRQGFMEEHMAEGAPNLRCLYYPRHTREDMAVTAKGLLTVLAKARELLKQGLDGPVPVNRNLSPVGKVFKAYGLLAHREFARNHDEEPLERGHLMQRDLKTETWMRDIWAEDFVYTNEPFRKTDPEPDMCLLSALRSSFDAVHPETGQYGKSGWFGTGGEPPQNR